MRVMRCRRRRGGGKGEDSGMRCSRLSVVRGCGGCEGDVGHVVVVDRVRRHVSGGCQGRVDRGRSRGDEPIELYDNGEIVSMISKSQTEQPTGKPETHIPSCRKLHPPRTSPKSSFIPLAPLSIPSTIQHPLIPIADNVHIPSPDTHPGPAVTVTRHGRAGSRGGSFHGRGLRFRDERVGPRGRLARGSDQ